LKQKNDQLDQNSDSKKEDQIAIFWD
ncbi:hypothetical protein LCGC14_0716670, partial [marine sediment metagenome]